jgi:hypothetical protein
VRALGAVSAAFVVATPEPVAAGAGVPVLPPFGAGSSTYIIIRLLLELVELTLAWRIIAGLIELNGLPKEVAVPELSPADCDTDVDWASGWDDNGGG